MRQLILFSFLFFYYISLSQAQVGIGTTTPKAFFNVSRGQTVLFGEDTNQVGSPNKLIWYASQGAFRAGYVDTDAWSRSSEDDNTRVGQYSFGSGYRTTASNHSSTAMGESTAASGNVSTAMGIYSAASGNYSTAIGASTTASGYSSTAMGSGTSASGYYSTAMGSGTSASGDFSTAMGSGTSASGLFSTAMGYQSTASGYYSMAMGTLVSTNQKQGSFILGDKSSNGSITANDALNQMMMRFDGGYKLFTKSDATVGVSLSSGGNAWQTISDSTRKENFRKVDGAGFLQKIARLKLGSWNYKGQDAKLYRHYGPMAQEFFSAFGHDELGVIGENKSINQADFDGVNLIAIQALIKENEQLKAQLAAYEEKDRSTQARLEKIEAALQQQTASNALTLRP